MDRQREVEPGDVLPGFEEPNDETMDEEVRRRLAHPPVNVPPAQDDEPPWRPGLADDDWPPIT